MVDPALTQSSQRKCGAPACRGPTRQAVPEDAGTGGKPVGNALTLGAIAEQVPGTAGCAAAIRYSAVWSTKLPQAFPLYPDAAVAEAAGNDADGCSLAHRQLSGVRSSPAKTLAWYAQPGRAPSGYSVERSGATQASPARAAARCTSSMRSRTTAAAATST